MVSVSTFKSFLEDADGLLSANDGIMNKQQWNKLVKMYEGQTIYFSQKDITQRERIDFVKAKLANGMSRAIIKARLMNRFGICKATAYRDINKGLSESFAVKPTDRSSPIGTHG